MKRKSGYGLIEIIIAVAIFATIAASAATTVVGSLRANRLSDEHSRATILAQEGIEAVRSIKNQGWEDPFLASDCSSSCGIDSNAGIWSWLGSNNVFDKFTRTVSVTGTDNPNIKKVTSTVAWLFQGSRNESVIESTYLSNWRTISPSPTPSPTTCNDYAVAHGYASGVCRQNIVQCNRQSEVHISAGDPYCANTSNADTCCAPSGGVTPTPTPGNCAPYCVASGFGGGICRQNPQQCNNQGESYQSRGNTYCTASANADTCCCVP